MPRGHASEKAAAAGKKANFEKWLSKFAGDQREDIDQKAINAWEKAYEKAYAMATAEAQQIAESYFGSFHEREKRLMNEERLLMEAGDKEGGSQWSISRTQMTNMEKISHSPVLWRTQLVQGEH